MRLRLSNLLDLAGLEQVSNVLNCQASLAHTDQSRGIGKLRIEALSQTLITSSLRFDRVQHTWHLLYI